MHSKRVSACRWTSQIVASYPSWNPYAPWPCDQTIWVGLNIAGPFQRLRCNSTAFLFQIWLLIGQDDLLWIMIKLKTYWWGLTTENLQDDLLLRTWLNKTVGDAKTVPHSITIACHVHLVIVQKLNQCTYPGVVGRNDRLETFHQDYHCN